jgi:hypothetical protein
MLTLIVGVDELLLIFNLFFIVLLNSTQVNFIHFNWVWYLFYLRA